MRALFAAGVLVFAISCDGCGGVRGEADIDRCVTDDGTQVSVGQSVPAGDRCNTCLCTADLEFACTTRDCDPDNQPGEGEGEGDIGEGEGEPDTSQVGPCADRDRDGYHPCADPDFPERPESLDCDDRRFHVQPGGIEFPETPEDDNCNNDNSDFGTCSCGVASDPFELAGAMDLCGDVVAAATKSGKSLQFGVVDAYRGVIDERLRVRVDDPAQPPVIIGNSCLMTLSSGDAVGTSEDQDFSCQFSDPDPAAPDQTDEICDVAQLRLTLRVPRNAQGFAFDFMFLSMEWPEYLCLSFNDTFYSIVRTPAVNGGLATNAAFDPQNRPITVNVGFFENPGEWTVPLDGTPHGTPSPNDDCPFDGFAPGCSLPSYCNDSDLDVRKGSGSGWLTTSVPVIPGQQDLQLTLSIHDEGDGILDSIVLLDAFRWLPFEPELTTSKDGR